MTFSIAIRCPRTRSFGVAGTTSSIAVGARCLFIDAAVGVIITQHRTDPRLGPQGLALLRNRHSASRVVSALIASTPHEAWRELAVIDSWGQTAVHHGQHQQPIFASAECPDMVAVGNILRDPGVPKAMIAAARASHAAPLAERLLAALRAGVEAGGEIFDLRSAALQVAEHEGFSSVDLRIDLSEDPIGDLDRLWHAYAPQQASFVQRVFDPDSGGRATCSRDLLLRELTDSSDC